MRTRIRVGLRRASLVVRLLPACLNLLAGLGFVSALRGAAEAFPEFNPAAARDYVQAMARAVEAQSGEEADACYSLARVRSQLGEKDAAERLARRALERDPGRAEIHQFLADILILQDRMDEAARLLARAVELKPGIPGGQRRLGMVWDRLGDRSAAGAAFKAAVRQAPADATARLLLGRWLLDEGQAEEAARHLEKGCHLDPKLSGAFYALSQAQTRLGDAASARATRKTFEELKQQEVADLDARNRSYDDEKFMRVLAAGFHTETAGSLLRRQRNELAEAHLVQAMRIAPQETAAYEMRATLLLRMGRLAEAREACETLVRLQPEQAAYHVNLGTLLLQLNDHQRAVEELKRGLELDPRHPEGLNNLARFWLGARRDLPAALDLSHRLVALRPTAASYDVLGWALYANGQTNASRTAAAQAVELDPTNTVYRERYRRLQSPL